MNGHQKRAFDFVISLRDFYGDYHAKKEREAYITTTLYLGATAAFLARPWPGEWKALLVFGGVIGATVVAVILVGVQLQSRRVAARMVGACTTVATQWLTVAPAPEEYRPTRLGNAQWPHAVVQEFDKQRMWHSFTALVVLPPLLALWGGAVVCTSLIERAKSAMGLVFLLNAAGLTVGLLGAVVIGFFPPKAQDYNPDGSPANRVLLESGPTAWGRFRVRWDPWLRLAGPCLLALGFFFQILALLAPGFE